MAVSPNPCPLPRRMNLRLCAYLGLCAGVMIALSGSAVRAQAPQPTTMPTTMIVFDASGSMWGRIEGDKAAKFVVAREALRTALAKSPADSRLGLTLFGHRRQGDCSDVQVVLPPEVGKADRHLGPLEKLNPKGRGPIAAALRETAKALASAPAPRTVVIVHDDHDNCQGDPCAALSELQAAAPEVVIHALGIGVKDDPQRFQCLTKPTNGRLLDIQSASQLQQAVEEVLTASNTPSPTPAAATPTAKAPPAAPTAPIPSLTADGRKPLATTGGPAARLYARYPRGRALDTRAITWILTPSTPGGLAIQAIGQDVSVPVPAGTYEVRARDGLVSATRTITVKAQGETEADVALEAGFVALKFADAEDQSREALAALSVTLLELDVQSGQPKPTGLINALEFGDAGGLIAVPPGNYVMRLQKGAHRLDRPVIVSAASTTELDATMGAGSVTVAVRTPFDATSNGNDAASPFGALIRILEDDPDAPGGRREIARASTPQADFVLPAGTYTVAVSRGNAETRERLALTAGAAQKLNIQLPSARLTIKTILKPTPRSDGRTGGPVSFRIDRIDVVPAETVLTTHGAPVFELSAGRYRVEMKHGNGNARTAFEIALAQGQNEEVVVEPPIATVDLVFGSGAAPLDLTWDIRNAAGLSVYTSAQPNPRVLLLIGTYTVRAETRGRRFERTFNAEVAKSMTVTLGE